MTWWQITILTAFIVLLFSCLFAILYTLMSIQSWLEAIWKELVYLKYDVGELQHNELRWIKTFTHDIFQRVHLLFRYIVFKEIPQKEEE